MAGEVKSFDVQAGHRHFAGECFNRTWGYIDRAKRTAEEDEAMVLTAAASLWHWMQRTDGTAENLSVGHWLLSRALALVGRGVEAMRHGRRALECAGGLAAFYVGYGHEAVARAALVLGERAVFAEHLGKAEACAAAVTDAEERGMLEKDLGALRVGEAAACQKTSVVRELVPLLFVQDIAVSVAFYRDRLGFELAGKWEPGGRLAWCRMRRDGAAVMLQQAEGEDGPAEGRGRGIGFYFNCNDVEAMHEEVMGRGLECKPPKVAFYGENQLSVRDPDGYALCFQSPAKHA